jgi:hypothetical protein
VDRISQSSLRAWNAEENKWNLSIGQGLFAAVNFTIYNEIIRFNGSYISKAKWEEIRAKASQGDDEWRYCITVIEDLLYLNCYEKFKKGLCYASYANDNRNCVLKDTENAVAANAISVVCPRTKRVYLRAKKNIKEGEEILWEYGDEFFPTQTSSSTQTQSNNSDSSYTPN